MEILEQTRIPGVTKLIRLISGGWIRIVRGYASGKVMTK